MELIKISIGDITNLFALSAAIDEFEKCSDELWSETPPWKRYQGKLMSELVVLSEHKERAITLAHFEKINSVDGLYSIRNPKTKKNLRVLYTIQEGYIILLTVFLEKSKNDYKKAIAIASSRMKLL